MTDKNESNVSEVLTEVNSAALSIEFTFIFGSNYWSKIATFVLNHAEKYLFFSALVLIYFELGFLIYNFYNNTNKNINEISGLSYVVAKTAVITAAVTGGILFAPQFILLTPIFFVVSISMDLIRSVGLLCWNIFSLADLYFSNKNNIHNDFSKQKYNKLKSIYIKNIWEYSILSLTSLIMTAATVIVFLMPHISPAFVATAVILGPLKTTIAGFAGMIGGATMFTTFFAPIFTQAALKFPKFCKSLYKRLVNQKDEAIELITLKSKTPTIDNTKKLNKAMNVKVDHHNFYYRAKDRELIIENISQDKPELARGALASMAETKSKELPKSQTKKIQVANIIKAYANGEKVIDNFGDVKSNAASVLDYINRKFPSINYSFLRHESDTKNLVNAFQVYADRFERQAIRVS